MNNREVKEILLLYRPGISGEEDQETAQALELTKRDAELASWFEEHCALQDALRANFRQIAVPQGLWEQIISERKAHTQLRFPRRALLVAAAVVLLALISVGAYSLLRPRPGNTFVNFSNRMAGSVARGQYPQMDKETNDLGAIQQFLASKGQSGYQLPKGLEKATPTGCKILEWRSNSVAMLCFNSGTNAKPDEPDLFLFVVARSAIRQAPSTHLPKIEPRNRRFTTASWTSGDKAYLLGGLGDERFLRKFL
ncbi:conserved hypothetical protein [Verrucomicrobia bacterium]|nr:conserved hypothetical protein [Verrucomicrobiota bacterium]